MEVTEIREVDIVGDRHAVPALPEFLNECAAIGEGFLVQDGGDHRFAWSVHCEAIQHGGKLAARGMHGSKRGIGSIPHDEVEANIPLRRCGIVCVYRSASGMIQVNGLSLPKGVLGGIQQVSGFERCSRLPCQ